MLTMNLSFLVEQLQDLIDALAAYYTTWQMEINCAEDKGADIIGCTCTGFHLHLRWQSSCAAATTATACFASNIFSEIASIVPH